MVLTGDRKRWYLLGGYFFPFPETKQMANLAKLGDRVRDPITGFQGTVIGITGWLDGTSTAHAESDQLQGGKPVQQAFPLSRLEVLTANARMAA